MKLAELVDFIRIKASKCDDADNFFVFGRYGYVRTTVHRNRGGSVHFTIDSHYRHQENQVLMQKQNGFRLSTLCCLCAGILYGENALDLCTINAISRKL